jgi:lipopolysaccharide export system permease protein
MQQQNALGFWVRQRSPDGQSIVYAASSQEQGVRLDSVSVFTFDLAGKALERIEAKRAVLEPGQWRLEQARIYASGEPPRDRDTFLVKTNLTSAQVRESFSTPETVPFWELPAYIEIAERSGLVAAGYKLQYQLKILPLWRCTENGFEWRGGRLSALCTVQNN